MKRGAQENEVSAQIWEKLEFSFLSDSFYVARSSTSVQIKTVDHDGKIMQEYIVLSFATEEMIRRVCDRMQNVIDDQIRVSKSRKNLRRVLMSLPKDWPTVEAPEEITYPDGYRLPEGYYVLRAIHQTAIRGPKGRTKSVLNEETSWGRILSEIDFLQAGIENDRLAQEKAGEEIR